MMVDEYWWDEVTSALVVEVTMEAGGLQVVMEESY